MSRDGLEGSFVEARDRGRVREVEAEARQGKAAMSLTEARQGRDRGRDLEADRGEAD